MSVPKLRCLFLLIGCVPLLTGCGGLPAPADDVKGEEALRTAFESWKKGETPETLQKARPPIYLNDPEWVAGNKLLSYEVVGAIEPYGRQLRCTVKLSLQSAKDGSKYEKRIGYQVETNPVFVIAREGL